LSGVKYIRTFLQKMTSQARRLPERRVFIDKVTLLEGHHLLDLRDEHEVPTVFRK